MVTGGSEGGSDQLLAVLLARAAGVSLSDLNDVAYSGGGDSRSVLLGGVDVGISAIGEYLPLVRAGRLRPLAVSGAFRSAILPHVPTLREEGVDSVLEDWRGLLGAPGLRPAELAELRRVVTAAHRTAEWRAALVSHGWHDRFLATDEFATFLRHQQTHLRTVLVDSGLLR